MKRITWFDFLCILALLFSACTLMVKSEAIEDGSDVVDATMLAGQGSTPLPIGSVPTRTLDLYQSDTVRETDEVVEATPYQTVSTSTPWPRLTSAPSSTPIPTTDPQAALSGVSPWVVYGKSTGEGAYFVVNVDGSGRSIVNIQEGFFRYATFSPSGFQMAYLVEGEAVLDQKLVVAQFPDGNIEAEVALFSSDWQTLYWGQTNWEQTLQAVGQMLWSPGGRYLAFVGALNGFSSDLYVFDLSTKEVRQLTDGPDQALVMDWSPDGEWIVHQSVAHFGTGAGIGGDAVWAAALDGSEVRHLYDAYPQQVLAAWMDSRRFVVFELCHPYGATNILRASIDNGDPLMVYEGPLVSIVRFSVKHGLAVFILPELAIGEEIREGVYTTSLQYPSSPQLILPGKWDWASCWWERGMCFAIKDAGKLAGFELGGELKFTTDGPAEKGKILASPKEDLFAVYNDQGAWLYDGEGELVRQIIDMGVEKFLWEPGGNYFFVLTDENQMLYVGNAYDGSLALVDTGVSKSRLRMVW